MEDDLKKKYGRRPQKKRKTTSKKKRKKRKTTKQNKKILILLNLGANLSWGWLSSLRFLFIYLALHQFQQLSFDGYEFAFHGSFQIIWIQPIRCQLSYLNYSCANIWCILNVSLLPITFAIFLFCYVTYNQITYVSNVFV